MFYIVMALENALLMFLWSFGSGDMIKPFIALGLFCCGLVFMAIYYQFFHVRRLKYESGGRLSNATNSNTSTVKLALEAKYKDQLNVPNGKVCVTNNLPTVNVFFFVFGANCMYFILKG